MSETKTALDHLKLSFEEFKKTVSTILKKNIKFGSMMTADGKELTYEGDLAEGVAVMIDGAPAPDGTYTLEDGTVCDVAGGTITKITMPGANNEDGYDEKFSAVNKRFEDFEAKYNESTSKFAEQMEGFNKALSGIVEQLGKNIETMNKFAAQEPAPAERQSRTNRRITEEAKVARTVEAVVQDIFKAKNN